MKNQSKLFLFNSYTYLRKLLRDLGKKNNYETDYNYDWNIIADEKKKKEE